MKAIIIGAGPAGCEAAYRLANKGFSVDLIEQESCIGGNINNWYQLFPDRKSAEDIVKILKENTQHPAVTLHLNTKPIEIKKDDSGAFSVLLSNQALLHSNILLLATGYDIFEAQRKEEYGYGIYENVITSVDLENRFRNHDFTLRNGKTPERIGLIHCVGSRDEKICNFHCSKLCCITAVKQAIEIREFLPDSEIICFYMDMRMFGPGYEEMYREAQEKYNIKFIRGRLSEASENIDRQIVIKAEDTLIGKPIRMTLDLMVLMVGMEAAKSGKESVRQLNLELSPNGFIKTQDPHYSNNKTNIKGVYVAGCATAPMNITDTLADARSAVEVILAEVACDK